MVKQLVIVNVAVPMSWQQISVQVSHASMLGILKQGNWDKSKFNLDCNNDLDLYTWLTDHFTLIVYKIWGKDNLMKLLKEASELGLQTSVMEDYGHTTAISIGPAEDFKLSNFKRLTLL
jgi:peptidyl-tRNA hydrolase